VLSGLVDFGVSFLMFVVLMIYYQIRPTPAIIWFPAFLLLAILLALGVGLWLSAMNAIYRDVRYVLPFVVQFWLFASPVVYPSSRVPEKWRWLYGLNPMAGVIEGFRWSLTGRGNPPGHLLLISSAMVVVVLLSGMAYFQKMETTMADVA
jgi:lipopolysaccharide transport system permease protein